jgi:hypothetical protein
MPGSSPSAPSFGKKNINNNKKISRNNKKTLKKNERIRDII